MHQPASHPNLAAAAEQIMRENGFAVAMPPSVSQQLADIGQSASTLAAQKDVRDLRGLLWSSIDNDTSRDLDQLEVAEEAPAGATKVLVAVADVDAFVPKDSPIDQFAAEQTTTVYMGIRNFPMLPEPLSTGITSLLQDSDRLAVVVEFVVTAAGELESSDVYRAQVRNKAQLTYDGVGPLARWIGRPTAQGSSVAGASGAAHASEPRCRRAEKCATSSRCPQHRDD